MVSHQYEITIWNFFDYGKNKIGYESREVDFLRA